MDSLTKGRVGDSDERVLGPNPEPGLISKVEENLIINMDPHESHYRSSDIRMLRRAAPHAASL